MTAGDEFAFIERMRRQVASRRDLLLGIGDDAAWLEAPQSGTLLVCKDVLMDGVHFDTTRATPAEIGRKALAVNLSDIAAMAGRPTIAIVGLVLPASNGPQFADDLMQGVLTLADEYDVALAGGDTNIWNGPAVVSITLLGVPTGNRPVKRQGAVPGDWLMVTGALGGSLGGRHLRFTPRVREAQTLHAAVDLHAMIDLSDGLASDLQHILQASGVGATLKADTIPLHDDLPPEQSTQEKLQHALSDGEDFELLFALSAEDGLRLLDDSPLETPLTHVGVITAETEAWLQWDSGHCEPLGPTGWQHRFA